MALKVLSQRSLPSLCICKQDDCDLIQNTQLLVVCILICTFDMRPCNDVTVVTRRMVQGPSQVKWCRASEEQEQPSAQLPSWCPGSVHSWFPWFLSRQSIQRSTGTSLCFLSHNGTSLWGDELKSYTCWIQRKFTWMSWTLFNASELKEKLVWEVIVSKC